MSESAFRTLRIVGLPLRMAATAVPAVLRGDTSAAVIGLVEIRGILGSTHAIDVAVGVSAVDRVRDRLYNSFAAIRIDDVTDGASEGGERRRAAPRKNTPKVGAG